MGTILFPLCFCGITAGNVINIFFINDVLLYPFPSHLLLIRTAPLYDGMGRWGAAAALLLGLWWGHLFMCGQMEIFWWANDWECPLHMHLTLKVNRKVYSDVRVHKHIKTMISGKQHQAFAAVVVILMYGICAKHKDLVPSLGLNQIEDHSSEENNYQNEKNPPQNTSNFGKLWHK